MQIQVQNKDFKYDLKNFNYMNRDSAFRVFTPPMSRNELCEVVFVPVIEGSEYTRTYSLGFYNDFGEAMGVVNQIQDAIKRDEKMFVMPDKAER